MDTSPSEVNTRIEYIYYIDTAPGGTCKHLKNIVETRMKMHWSGRAASNTIKGLNSMHSINIKCLRQQDSNHSGHFVLCSIEDILTTCQMSVSANFVHGPPLPSYPETRMEQFKLDWAGYLYNRFILHKVDEVRDYIHLLSG